MRACKEHASRFGAFWVCDGKGNAERRCDFQECRTEEAFLLMAMDMNVPEIRCDDRKGRAVKLPSQYHFRNRAVVSGRPKVLIRESRYY